MTSYSDRAQRWHSRRHRCGAVEDCWLCRRAQAICRAKKKMPTRAVADIEAGKFNEDHRFEVTVIPYWCVWCESYHMKSPKSPAEWRRSEHLRRRWLIARQWLVAERDSAVEAAPDAEPTEVGET